MKYKVVAYTSTEKMQGEVNSFLALGWDLRGHLMNVPGKGFYQVMTKG